MGSIRTGALQGGKGAQAFIPAQTQETKARSGPLEFNWATVALCSGCQAPCDTEMETLAKMPRLHLFLNSFMGSFKLFLDSSHQRWREGSSGERLI